jgi:hypothetical protein
LAAPDRGTSDDPRIWSLFAAATLAGGAALRVLCTYPVHRFPADADSLLTGMRAFLVLDGHAPVFYTAVRIGALESYLHAAVFSVFGASRETISVAPLLSGILTLFVFYFLVRNLAGRRAACFAFLLFAFPSAAFLLWTYMPNAYPETLLLGLAALATGAACREHPDSAALPAVFGLVSGLAFWNSFQALACIVPGALLLLQSRRGRPGAARALGLAAAGFAVGAAPWIAYNVRHSFESLRSNFATRPVSSRADFASNLERLLLVRLPELLVTGDAESGEPPREGWRAAAALAAYGAAAAALLLAFRPLPDALRQGRTTARGLWPLGLAGALAAAFFVLSQAGQMPGPTARYVFFLYPLFAACLGLLLARLSLRSFPLALAAALGAVAFNVSTYTLLPTQPRRQELEKGARSDTRFVAFLEQREIGAVIGDFWTVYPVNFLSRERVLGVPTVAESDFYDYTRRLRVRPVRWALMAWWPEERDRLALRAGVRGEALEPAPGIFVFLPRDGTSASEALERLRQAP